jgi:IS30 family transposase
MRVSHETIYLSLFVQARGALRTELARYLRGGRARRRPRGLSVMNGQGQLRGTVHISARPAGASDRAVPGHWEGDLIFGTRSSTIATLVERTSRFVLLVGLPGSYTADVVADALAEAIATLPEQLRRSLTLGPGQRDGRSRPVQRGDRRARLLLRPSQPLAARQQREHQRAAAPVLPPQHRLPGAHAE